MGLVLQTHSATTWSDRKIAAYTGTSHTLVAQIRAELARKPEDRGPAAGKIATAVTVEVLPEGGDAEVDQMIGDAGSRPEPGAPLESTPADVPLGTVLAAVTSALNRFGNHEMREQALARLIDALNVMLGGLRRQRERRG